MSRETDAFYEKHKNHPLLVLAREYEARLADHVPPHQLNYVRNALLMIRELDNPHLQKEVHPS